MPRYADRPRWHIALDAWAVVVIGAALWQILSQLGAYQWDVIVYWWGGRAFVSGQSPYGPIPGQPVYLHFVYPPLLAAVFAPMAAFNVTATKLIWITLKAIAFWATIRIWKRATGVGTIPVPPVFFFTFAFGAAALVDFTAGNISVFEQLVLWLGFAALLAKRPWRFAIAVALVAQFKLTPVFFLGVLLVIDEKPRWGPFIGGSALFLALFGANFVLMPAQAREFLTSVQSLGERGWGDPSTLGVMQDLVDQVQGVGIPVAPAVAYILYVAVVVAVLAITVRWWRARALERRNDRLVIVLVSIAVYALIMPRMKDYSYLALFPVGWYVLAMRPFNTGSIAVFAALLPRPLPQLKLWLPGVTQAYVYAPLAGALVVWAALVGISAAQSKPPADTAA
ncbi:MAG: glycosyltransferase family 87 protein [Gemmatimonadaceae bacterium]